MMELTLLSLSLLSAGFVSLISVLLLFVWNRKRKQRLNAFRKCVLITGCDSGIGLNLATHLYNLGFTVFSGCLSLDSDGAKLLADDESYTKERMHVIRLDVTKTEAIREARTYIGDFLGRHLDHVMWALVNNAGICIYGEFEWMTSDHIEKQIQVNLVGTIKTTKVFLSLIRQHKGRIINVGSVNGSCGYPGISVYCASKYGIEGFTDVLRYEMSKFDVKVILIRPGDFAKLTGIMAQHDKYAQEMWTEMNEGDRKLYHDYFKVYQKYVSDNYGLTSPKSFGHSTLFDDFEEALLSPSPRYYITVAPVAFRIFFKLLQFMSPSIKDSVIEFIISKGVNFNARAYFSD